MLTIKNIKLFLAAEILFVINIYAQSFTQVTDITNPIVTASAPAGYVGISWIDYDNDNNLDLFINNNILFKNTGGGSFTKISTDIGSGQILGTGNAGNSWADFDNDGDLDVYICSSTSFLYRNDGGNIFTKITTGEIGNGSANRGWACAWGDYDSDGFVDLVITHPAGFVGLPALNNNLLKNDRTGNFTRITSTDVTKEFQPFTVASWSDYDNDNDLDLFIGTGPANGVSATDFIFQNELAETGNANLKKINSGPLATTLRDGQVWNWIDYDNDGDLDVYITNWGGAHFPAGLPNDLYRNDGGTFAKITNQTIALDRKVSLASIWEDFDNDGDLDCYVANDVNGLDSYYRNAGNGTFGSIVNLSILSSQSKRSASAGDYDNDGRVDLVTIGPSSISLFHNDTENSNNWISFSLEGKVSNRSAIGAKIRVKANIGGNSYWQMREISAQNSFNSQNDLRAHFGLGDAAQIDTLKVEWPSGQVDLASNISANSFYKFVEGEGIASTTDIGEVSDYIPSGYSLEQNYPNPFNPTTIITYTIPDASGAFVSLKIYDILGNEIADLINEQKPEGRYQINFDAKNLSSGIYYYQLIAGNFVQTKKLLLLR